MKRKMAVLLLVSILGSSVAVCAETKQSISVTVFAAKSLERAVDVLIDEYQNLHPEVNILGCYDGSGTLMMQIREGAACDLFLSAAEKQMDILEEEGFVAGGSREDLVGNRVCVVTYKGSGTKVTGLENLREAKSAALADGSVPVGSYTRIAMVNLGLLPACEDPSLITTGEISDALDGIEINECVNVGACAAAVAEGANEVGTVYYSDTFGYGDLLEVIEMVPYSLTGMVVRPMARIVNDEADEAQSAAADDFAAFLRSDASKEVFEAFRFDTKLDGCDTIEEKDNEDLR